MVNTVQHTHVVTSVKQSPVLKGHLTYKDTFSFPKDDLSRQVLLYWVWPKGGNLKYHKEKSN